MYNIEYQDDMASINTKNGRIIVDREDDWIFEDKYYWSIDSKGYAVGFYWNKNWIKKYIKLSRLLTNCPEGMVVDHINHNKLDNRKCNLRICTHSQNSMNQIKKSEGHPLYKGVNPTYENKPWRGQITINGKNIFLGHFLTEEEAAKAYDKKAIELFGEFAYLNFPLQK